MNEQELLECLAPYLPYGVELSYGCILDEDNDYIAKIEIDHFHRVLYGYGSFVVKPILRPLSDLLDEEKDLWIDFSEEYGEINTASLREAIVYDRFYALDIRKSFRIKEILFKMHFDVFGLIDKGYAIDKNKTKP